MFTRAVVLFGVLCLVCTSAFTAYPPGPPPAVATVVANKSPTENGSPNITAEQRINDALAEKANLEFVETPIKEVFTFIADKHKFDIEYDVVRLRDAAIDPSEIPISLNVHGITLRSAMNLILQQNDLGFIIENEVLQITTKEKVNSTLVMRAYDVRDLVDGDNMSQLIDIVSSTPQGRAEIGVIKPLKTNAMCAIYVSKPVAVHEEIEQALAELRKLKTQKQ